MKFDLYLNFFFESFKHKFAAFIFLCLIYNIVQMSQADSVYTEKTCLSDMYDTSICNQHLLTN